MSPRPPVTLLSGGPPLNVPQEPPPPYPSRERRHRRRRTAVEGCSGDSDDHTFLGTPHPPPHPDENTPLLGVASPTRRPRTLSLSSAASISPSLAQTVVSAFRMDLDSDEEDDGEHGEETPHGRPAVSARPDGLLSQAPALTRHRARGWRTRWRHYFRPIGRKAYWSALLHLLVINFPYALLAWVYLFVFTLVSVFTWCDCISNLLMDHVRNSVG